MLDMNLEIRFLNFKIYYFRSIILDINILQKFIKYFIVHADIWKNVSPRIYKIGGIYICDKNNIISKNKEI